MRAKEQGEAIGLELTWEIAVVFMTWWDKNMRKKIEENGLEIVIYKIYVDDINMVVEVEKKVKEEELWKRDR